MALVEESKESELTELMRSGCSLADMLLMFDGTCEVVRKWRMVGRKEGDTPLFERKQLPFQRTIEARPQSKQTDDDRSNPLVYS